MNFRRLPAAFALAGLLLVPAAGAGTHRLSPVDARAKSTIALGIEDHAPHAQNVRRPGHLAVEGRLPARARQELKTGLEAEVAAVSDDPEGAEVVPAEPGDS